MGSARQSLPDLATAAPSNHRLQQPHEAPPSSIRPITSTRYPLTLIAATQGRKEGVGICQLLLLVLLLLLEHSLLLHLLFLPLLLLLILHVQGCSRETAAGQACQVQGAAQHAQVGGGSGSRSSGTGEPAGQRTHLQRHC